MQDWGVDRADLQFDAARVEEFLRQRDPVPGEDRLAHVDGNRPVLMFGGVQDAGNCLEGEGLAPRFGGERLHDAARAVAAGLRLGPVRIQDIDPGVGAVRLRIVDRHDLVELGLRIGVQRNRRFRRHLVRSAAHVDDEDLVAKPVHLREFDQSCHCLRSRWACRSRPYMAETAFNYQSADMLRHRYRVPARLELLSGRAHAHAKPLKVCKCGSACAWPSAFFRDFRSLQVIVSPRCTQDRSCAWTAQPNRAWRPGGGLIGGTSFNAPAMPFTSLPSPHVTASGQGAGSHLPANASRNTPATEAVQVSTTFRSRES